jgi:hypothetical protein
VHYEIVGKSHFNVPDDAVIDALGAVDGETRLVFGVASRAIRTMRLEMSDGTAVDVNPARPGLVATWPMDTFFAELPAAPALRWIRALDADDAVLDRIEPHERQAQVHGRSTPR